MVSVLVFVNYNNLDKHTEEGTHFMHELEYLIADCVSVSLN